MRDTMYMQIMFDMAPNISNNIMVNINAVSPGSKLVLLDIDIDIVTLELLLFKISIFKIMI